MNIDILQQFIQLSNEYLIGERFVNHYGRCADVREAVFLAPQVSQKYWGVDLNDMKYSEVVAFGDEELLSTIHLGGEYQPFQHGIRRKEFINLTKVTCRAMDLIIKCHNEKITDYYKAIKAMEEILSQELPKTEDEQ